MFFIAGSKKLSYNDYIISALIIYIDINMLFHELLIFFYGILSFTDFNTLRVKVHEYFWEKSNTDRLSARECRARNYKLRNSYHF